jgi:hypothetical protein
MMSTRSAFRILQKRVMKHVATLDLPADEK